MLKLLSGSMGKSSVHALKHFNFLFTHTQTLGALRFFCSHTVLQICIVFNPKRAALEYQASPTQFSLSQLWKYLWLKIKMLLHEIFFFPHGKFLRLFCPLVVSREGTEQN